MKSKVNGCLTLVLVRLTHVLCMRTTNGTSKEVRYIPFVHLSKVLETMEIFYATNLVGHWTT